MIEIVKLHHNLPAKFERLHRDNSYYPTCGFWFKLWKWGLKIEWAESFRTRYCADCSRKIDIDEWYYRGEEYLCPNCYVIYRNTLDD